MIPDQADRAEPGDPPFVLEVCNELDLASLEWLRRELHQATTAGSDVLIDLTRCEFMDTDSVQELLAADQRLSLAQRRLVIVCRPDGPLNFVLRLVARQALTVYPTRQLGEIALQLR